MIITHNCKYTKAVVQLFFGVFMENDHISAKFPFYGNLSDEQKCELKKNSSVFRFAKGEHIHSANDDCLGIVYLLRGQIRVYMISEDGREITLYRLFENDVCALTASCVLDAVTFDVFIDAEEDCELLAAGAAFFRRLKSENIYVEAFIYKIATQRFSDVMWAMQQILFMGMDKRLAIFLSDEISRSGENFVKLTHEQIARYIGSAREVVSRMLKYFESEKIVELSRKEIRIIDKKKLKSYF